MRLVVTQNITLDGVIEQSEPTGDWFGTASGDADTADLEAALSEMMAAEDAQFSGRDAFESMRLTCAQRRSGRAHPSNRGGHHLMSTNPPSASAAPLPPIVDDATWRRELDELRAREKAATRELDSIAAQRRRLPDRKSVV